MSLALGNDPGEAYHKPSAVFIDVRGQVFVTLALQKFRFQEGTFKARKYKKAGVDIYLM